MAFLTKEHSRGALKAALQVRKRIGVDYKSPINVFDFAEQLGIEVKFARIGSFGGMWIKEPPTILISSLRPYGRQVYTCAHELGHWFYEHGLKVDLSEIQEVWHSNDHEEQLVNAFGGFLLMPSWAIKQAFHRRSWPIEQCTPLQVYIVSCQLGVSYEALATHMCYSVRLILQKHLKRLLDESPSSIRYSLLPNVSSQRVVVIDNAWEVVPIDVQVGDHILVWDGVKTSGACIGSTDGSIDKTVFRALSPGIARLHDEQSKWSAYVRVSRRDFEGRSIYRHLEDPDIDE